MKTLITSVAVIGLAINSTASADHRHSPKIERLAKVAHSLAHSFEEEAEGGLPYAIQLRRDARSLSSYAHTTENLIARRSSPQSIDRYVDAMRSLTKRIDRDLHDIEHNLERFRARGKLRLVRHLLDDIHRIDHILDELHDAVEDLDRVVILPHPHPGHGHLGHGGGLKNKGHVNVNPGGLHVHKGGFQFNLRF